MAQKNYYAIARGRQTGIFRTWAEVEKQVKGYPNARYQGFGNKKEASDWLNHHGVTATSLQAPGTAQAEDVAVSAQIQVFTDGGSRNTGNHRGGHVQAGDLAAWAYLIVWPTGERHQATAGQFGATNNQMELQAFIEALTYLQKKGDHTQAITLTSDSRYLLNAIEKNWLQGWQRRHWHKAGGTLIANPEQWQKISQLLPQFTNLQLKWAKGHADNPGNIYVDRLLNQTMDQLAQQQN